LDVNFSRSARLRRSRRQVALDEWDIGGEARHAFVHIVERLAGNAKAMTRSDVSVEWEAPPTDSTMYCRPVFGEM
jgi:hypothetical protein